MTSIAHHPSCSRRCCCCCWRHQSGVSLACRCSARCCSRWSKSSASKSTGWLDTSLHASINAAQSTASYRPQQLTRQVGCPVAATRPYATALRGTVLAHLSVRYTTRSLPANTRRWSASASAASSFVRSVASGDCTQGATGPGGEHGVVGSTHMKPARLNASEAWKGCIRREGSGWRRSACPQSHRCWDQPG